MTKRLLPLIALLLLAIGCALWQTIPASPSGAAPARIEVPQATPERSKAALFYSDLGPESVDVSAYPPERKRDYAVYAQACSRCHTLARSINAPYVSRGWWEFYVARMRVRAKR